MPDVDPVGLAASDVAVPAEALLAPYQEKTDSRIDGYFARALERVWKAERFSWWFTSLTHRFPDAPVIDRRPQVAELDDLRQSKAARTVFAENDVGLPLEAA